MRPSRVSMVLLLTVSLFGLAACTPAVDGAPGSVGPSGAQGEAGTPGADGAPGETGATGPTGPRGATGATGGAGAPGVTGPAGPLGAPGAPGTAGTPGAAGLAGPPGVSGYAYITNSDAQVVPDGTDVIFNNSSVLTSDFAHVAGSSTITINAAGTFAVWFSVSGIEPNQFAIAQNGVAIASSRYGSGAGTQQTTGMTIVTLAAGDVLSLRNSSSLVAVTLLPFAGGTAANINASMMIQKLD